MGRSSRLKQARKTERQPLEAERPRAALPLPRQRWLVVVAAMAIAFAAVLGVSLALRGGSGTGAAPAAGTAPAVTGRALAGQAIPVEGQEHVQAGTDVDYDSNPPTSGNHWPTPAEWTIYRSPIPDEMLVHNLEHGGIWISYKGIDAPTRQRLEALAAKYPQAVVLSPRPQNDSKIALASWGRLEKLNAFSEGRILAFISANINNSPEPLAIVEQAAIEVGAFFPAFRVADAGSGQALTPLSLRGKPSIIWFTTSYCVPCQIGAQRVSQLDDQLGGKAFNVLVLFVDPREPVSALVDWKRQFARPDWSVAFDQDLALAKKVELRFLDTKFLLDRQGAIRNIDFNIADDRYADRIRDAVKQAR